MERKYESSLTEAVALISVCFEKKFVLFKFNQMIHEAWLENVNKHIPEVYGLCRLSDSILAFDTDQLKYRFVHSRLKLSIAAKNERLNYLVNKDAFKIVSNSFFHLNPLGDEGCFSFDIVGRGDRHKIDQLNYIVSTRCELYDYLSSYVTATPLSVCVIGSCFTRSIFQSDSYFNPGYKKYFNVTSTFFHNSIISILSNVSLKGGYNKYEDLRKQGVEKYIQIEFDKDFEARLNENPVEFLIIDNYSDAALPLIEMMQGCYITYNRYFSESIFRKEFVNKKIIQPGSDLHVKLYKESIIRMVDMLKQLNLEKKIILVGGRLSIQKTNGEIWTEKIDWINFVNTCWDIYDSIFLNYFPDAKYIDMRNTGWKCDLNSPIMGGASPAHYQSEFYKDIYNQIRKYFGIS